MGGAALSASAEVSASPAVAGFSDVHGSDCFADAVAWAKDTGVTATTFGAGSSVAYDQMPAFLTRVSGADTNGGRWSQAAIDWAADNGLTDGLTFTAKGACPRSEVIYCLWKQWHNSCRYKFPSPHLNRPVLDCPPK